MQGVLVGVDELPLLSCANLLIGHFLKAFELASESSLPVLGALDTY